METIIKSHSYVLQTLQKVLKVILVVCQQLEISGSVSTIYVNIVNVGYTDVSDM